MSASKLLESASRLLMNECKVTSELYRSYYICELLSSASAYNIPLTPSKEADCSQPIGSHMYM